MKTEPEKTFTDQELTDIQAEVRRIKEAEGLSWTDVANESGIAGGTISGFAGGSYQGNNQKLATTVQSWFLSREAKRRTAQKIRPIPDFQTTKTAARILETCRYAQAMPEIAAIVGAPGVGKTMTLAHYAAINPNVWMATAEPASKNTFGMLGLVSEAMGIEQKQMTKLARDIATKVRAKGGLVIVDEAQHLTFDALEQLRSLYDKCSVGVVLAGNESVAANITGVGKAQMSSRVGLRLNLAKPAQDDICDLIKAWGVTDKEVVRTLKVIARKPGALRTMTKTLRLASMIAAGAGAEIAFAHIQAAFARIDDSTRPAAA